MALLGMIQKVTDRLGLAQPSSVIGNNNAQITQLLALANEEGEELASRYCWSALQISHTFTIALSASQGAVNGTVVTNSDFDYYINDTFWNRTTSLPILGPTDAVEWQTLQAFPVTGPYQQHRFQGKNLYLDPVPTSADTGAFEYYSTHWCEDSGATGQSSWAADDDVGRLDENLMILGIRWRWKKAKGLDYAQDYDTYEQRLNDAMARDGGKRILNLESRNRDYRQAGVVIPIGSWTPT